MNIETQEYLEKNLPGIPFEENPTGKWARVEGLFYIDRETERALELRFIVRGSQDWIVWIPKSCIRAIKAEHFICAEIKSGFLSAKGYWGNFRHYAG